jgi:hypothetical protein
VSASGGSAPLPAFAFNEQIGASSCSSIYNSAASFLYELAPLVGPGPTVIPWTSIAQGFYEDGAANWERLRNDANNAPEIDFVPNNASTSFEVYPDRFLTSTATAF